MDVGSEADLQCILSLESEDLLTVFSESRLGYVDVIIAPENLAECQQRLQSDGLSSEERVADVGEKIRQEQAQLLSAAPIDDGSFNYKKYHRYDVMVSHLESLVANHSTSAEIVDVGTSYEGRTIKAIRMTADISSAESDDKPMLWLDGGIHAREWVSPSTVMYIIDAILGEHETDKADKMAALLAKFQIVIAPCINPDGYEYTHTKERFWRKTRKPSGCRWGKKNWYGGCYYEMCYGADPNRNWSADWGNSGVSKDRCSLVYPGKEPFDQENTKAVKTYLENHSDKLKLYATYHSYSQLFLTPVGYTTEKPDNWKHHKKVGDAVVAAIKQRTGVKYIAMQSAGLYPASGDSADWVHDVLGLTDSYTFELRPDENSGYGFDLPADQIIPTGQENVDGLLALIENIEYNNV